MFYPKKASGYFLNLDITFAAPSSAMAAM